LLEYSNVGLLKQTSNLFEKKHKYGSKPIDEFFHDALLLAMFMYGGCLAQP